MGDIHFSPGGVAALVTLSEEPQEVEIIVQIKEKLSFTDQYAVSDGVHWVPVFLGPDVRRFNTLRIIQITSACYYRDSGHVFVDNATIVGDPTDACIFGNPEELALELGSRMHFPISRLRQSTRSWREEPEESSYPPIRALVTYMSKLDEEITHSGNPPFFMIHLLDETGEIRAHASDGVARELYDHLEEGKVYYIYNTSISTSNYCIFYNLAHSYKLILTRETVIEECHETVDIPILTFDFMQLDQISQAQDHTVCDVIGIVSYVGPLEVTNNRRTNQKARLFKREILIEDQTENIVPAFLWANRAEEFDVPTGTVVAFRNVKVITVNQTRCLSVLSPSTIHIEPQMEEAVTVHRWDELTSDFEMGEANSAK